MENSDTIKRPSFRDCVQVESDFAVISVFNGVSQW